jgi:1-aminocyclopropane-1-carboxylate deaminase
MKRDDLIDAVVSGNKWRKLAGYIDAIAAPSHIVSYGGAHSNHLAAAAKVLSDCQHRATFIVRGDELNSRSSAVLRYCTGLGVKLIFITRSEFRQLREHDWQPNRLQRQQWQLPDSVQILPEGGSGPHNRLGCAELWQELLVQGQPDQLWLAAGTGGTARGLLAAMPMHCPTHVHIVSAVRGSHREARHTQQLAQDKGISCQWFDETTFGGFAKETHELRQAQYAFTSATNIPLDPVYNAKVWWHLRDMANSGHLGSGRIVWLHTGGFDLRNSLQD